MADEFTDGAIPPADAPEGVLAWIELPHGNIYLDSELEWITPSDPGQAAILNHVARFHHSGPSGGCYIAQSCKAISDFYDNQYPVYKKITEDGPPGTVY